MNEHIFSTVIDAVEAFWREGIRGGELVDVMREHFPCVTREQAAICTRLADEHFREGAP